MSSECTSDDDYKCWLRIKSMWPYRPRDNELYGVANNREKEALLSWYERLNEFDEFRKRNGHGK